MFGGWKWCKEWGGHQIVHIGSFRCSWTDDHRLSHINKDMICHFVLQVLGNRKIVCVWVRACVRARARAWERERLFTAFHRWAKDTQICNSWKLHPGLSEPSTFSHLHCYWRWVLGTSVWSWSKIRGCPECIEPFWISREPVAWPWCNLASSQRRPYCASVNSHSPVGLVNQRWDTIDWDCVLCDLRIHNDQASWSASSWQCTCLFYSSLCRLFWQSITSPRSVSPPAAQIWLPATSGFSQS